MTAPTQTRQNGPTPEQFAALVALVEAQAAVRGQLSRTAIAAAVVPFRALSPNDWWDAGKVGAAITQALKIVQPSQRQAARVTDAYLARAASVMTGRPVSPAGAVDVTRLRRDISERVAHRLVSDEIRPPFVVLGDTHDGPGPHINAPAGMVIPETGADAKFTDPADPYGRVADAYRYQVIAKGTPNEQVRKYALARIAAVAETDVTLAVREQVRKSLGKIPGVTGYRRILRPELSQSGPCGLCVVAADRLYKKQDLKPLHSRCVCETLPVIGGLDPGLELNRADLDRIYAAAGGETGGGKRQKGALKRIRVALTENGELGPVLVDADQHHRGPREVAATKVADKAVRYQAQLKSLEDSFAVLQRRAAAGENVEKPIAWQANRIDELRRELAGAV